MLMVAMAGEFVILLLAVAAIAGWMVLAVVAQSLRRARGLQHLRAELTRYHPKVDAE